MGQLPWLLSVGVIAATFLVIDPVSANNCLVGCHGLRGGKGHVEGNTYIYDFEGTSVTSVSQGQGDSTVKLSATVELAAKPDCIRQLKLKNVLLNGAPVSQKDVEQHVLQFNYHDGHIDTGVCTEPNDSQASLNIKRAVASLFQTAVIQDSGATTHRETDVFGHCETNFEFNKEGDKLTVNKRKNLATCYHRANLRHGLFYSSYDESAEVISSPILDSHQAIQQVYDKGILSNVKSTETYMYQPFSNGDAGAKTVIESTLTLKSSSADGKPGAPVKIPKSLVFEAPHPVVKSSTEAIINSLKAIKETSTPVEIKRGAAEKFGNLITVLRKSNKKDILAVYNKLKAGEGGFDKNYDRKILLDALYRTGTGEAAEVAVELIKNKELSPYQVLAYLASLSLIDHVNLPAVTAVVSLLDEKHVPRIGYLGIGNIIGKYCRDHECENVPEVKQALSKIISKIPNGKPENRQSENEMIAAMKALGNAKYLDDQTIEKLVNIVNNKVLSSRLRVAAIEALPAKCTMKWKTPMLDVLANRVEDSEIRIKVYLSMIACPCAPVANRIKEIIDQETINQVGSFITTHLKNLRASTDPSKANAKKYFDGIKPRPKFPIDFRKFSFNNELSYKIDKYGVGSTVEQNVIYSERSWVPRSVSLNLTSELFGRSFNFLEIDTRMENLDRLIEHYIGPKGIVRQTDISDLVINGTKSFSDVYNRVKDRFAKLGRERRAALNPKDVEKFTNTIVAEDGNEIDDDLDIDISVKMFGLELAFLDIKDNHALDTDQFNPTMDRIQKIINDGLNKAKNFDYSASSHLHFMDIDIIYPTGMGFPLSVGIEGNGVANVKSSGKIDVQSIVKDPKNAVIKLGLEPSVSITIAASLTLDTFGVETGLKVIGDLHTSTGGDLSLKVLDGHGFDLSFGIPKRKQEIISVSSQVVMIDKNGGKSPVKFSRGKEYSDCFDQFSTILGLSVCGQFSDPFESLESIDKQPLFPISAPGKFAISLENTDATSYHLRAFYDKSKPNFRSMEILLETPNSRTNRKVLLRVEGSNEPTKKYIKGILESPFKDADGEIALENTDKKKALTVSLKHDDDVYFGSIGLAANGNKYKPILEYKVPQHIERLTGGKGGKGEGTGAAYKLDGDITVTEQDQQKKYVFDKIALLAHDKILASLDGSVLVGPRELVVDSKISHKDDNVQIKLDGKGKDKGFDVDLSFVPSKKPNSAFQVVWHYDMLNEEIDHSFILTYGADLQSKTNRFSLIEHLTYKKSDRPTHSYVPLSSLKYKSELAWPASEFNAKLEAELSTQNLETEIAFQYGKFKIGSELEVKVDEGTPSNWEFEFDGYVVDNKMSLGAKHKKIAGDKRKFEGKLEIPGGKYEVEATSVHHIEGTTANIGFDSKFKLNGKKLDINYGVEVNPQKLNSHALVNFDNTKYLDFLLKGARGSNPHGEFNLLVKKIILVAGQFTYQNGKGTSTITIDLPRFERKIKGSADLAITGSRHVASIDILLDAEKDPNKRIKLSTDSDVTKTSIDSKNVLEILSNKIELNGKGKVVEKQPNVHDCEGSFDLLLPNGRYFVGTGKGYYDRQATETKMNGKYELLDHQTKGGPSRKIAYEYGLSMSEPKHDTVDAKHKLSITNIDNKNLQLNFANKYVGPVDAAGVKRADIELIASGSYLPKEFKFMFNIDRKAKNLGTWKLDSSFGDDLTVNGVCNYFHGYDEGKPSTTDISFALKLPNDKLRNLKYDGKLTLLLPKDQGEVFQYTTVESLTYNDDRTISADVDIRCNGLMPGLKKEAAGKLKLVVFDRPPLTIDTHLNLDPSQETKKADASVTVNHGDKHAALNVDTTYKMDLTHIAVNVKAETPTEKYRNVELGFERKADTIDGPQQYNAHLTADGKKYDIKSEFELKKDSRRVDMVFTCPEGKSELHSLVKILGENELKGEWKITTPKGFVVADAHVNFDSMDDFAIDFNFDSDRVKERKIHAAIASQPAVKTGKKIVITVTSDGKNIVAGSTNYNKRDEAGKVIIEGSGSLKIGDNTRSSKFMYSRKQLTRENDGEIGVAILLNANFGPSAVVGELKLSDKELHVFNSFCEQSKDCAHFKLQSIVDVDHDKRINHQITVEVDSKKFYVPVEFGLKTTTKFSPKEETFDHTANLYLHTSKDKTQYSTHIYANADESAIILTVPKRELALIISINVPKSKTPVGPYKIDISAYLDRKNHPNDKTSFVASGDISADKKSSGISGEARFIYPTQTKDMIIKGKIYTSENHYLDANVDIDVFAKKTQKITVIAQLFKTPLEKGYNVTGLLDVKSPGQKLDVDVKNNLALSPTECNFEASLSYDDINGKRKTVGAQLHANNKNINFKIQGPNKYIIQCDTAIELTQTSQKIETKHQILDNPPIVVSVETRDFNHFKYQSYQADKPDNKLVMDGRIVSGQIAEFHADAHIDGEKKHLFDVALFLDENRFLKPTLGYNKDNIAFMIEFYRAKVVRLSGLLKDAATDVNNEAITELKDLFDHLKKSEANWKPIIEYYQQELKKLKEEIESDKTLHEIIEAYNRVFGGITTAITKIIQGVIEHIQELNKQFNDIVGKVNEAIKSMSPKIKESLDKICKAMTEIVDATSKLASIYVKAIFNIITEHQKEIKEIVTLFSEIARDIIKILSKGFGQIEGEVKNFIAVITKEIKSLKLDELVPLTKYKWSDIAKYQIPEAVLMPIEEAVVQITKLLPTEELRQFVTATYNYIIKIVKHQTIDDKAELKNIYARGIDALRSIIALLQHQDINQELYGLMGGNMFSNLRHIKKLPGFPIIKLSLINLVKNGDLPNMRDIYYTYRPKLAADIPPFSKMASVIEGGHFFTFDGRHLTMAGTCDYVLAHDARDKNFTIIGTFNSGKFISLTITAPGESITLKSNGNILVNEKPGDYPASTKNLHAFLTLPIVNVKSDYGVHVACSQKSPMICSVYVSGFYHGRVRGILGDANNEPYDDFTLPSGQITEKESDFGNAYRINQVCPAAPAVDHHDSHAHNPTCTSYFADTSSSMSDCFNYVNPNNFRQACDHATAAQTPRAACLISAAYYAACRKEGIAIAIPAACAACKVGKDIAVGDSFSVKIPAKEADIVFVIEQNSKNEKVYHDMIVPLMTEVKNEFKQHGITDVNIGLIGYGEHMKWPQHYTTGGSTNINGEVKNLKFVETPAPLTLKEAKEGDLKTRLKYIKQRLDVELGTFTLTDAYKEAITYPFRTESAKAVIAIIASPCEKSPLPLSLQQLRLFMGQKVYRDLGLSYHHIGFLNDILVSGKQQKNVVGYDSAHAYTFSDAKKKPLEGTIDKANLVLTNNDVCAGFAVSSGGAAFSSSNFLDAKPNQRKQFLQVTARRIVEGLTSVELNEDCICKQQSGLMGHASCKIVGRKEKRQTKVKG